MFTWTISIMARLFIFAVLGWYGILVLVGGFVAMIAYDFIPDTWKHPFRRWRKRRVRRKRREKKRKKRACRSTQ